MEMLRVLFGYDGTIGADAALTAMTTFSWPAGTHIRLIGVRDAHLRFLRPLTDEILFVEFEEVVSRAARCLRAEVPVAAIDERVVRGPAVIRILTEAERLGADLIVVGSRNQGPMRSAFLGSVAHGLAAAARAPVLVARGSHVGRVLLVHDGSEAARAAMRIVSSWGIFSSSSVKMFSVVGLTRADACAQVSVAVALEEPELVVLGISGVNTLGIQGSLAGALLPRLHCSVLAVPSTGPVRDVDKDRMFAQR
jgi:nucleotide-binding universal stress UspA family protein